MHIETGGAGGGDAATGRMLGSIARFRAEAAAGRVSIDPESTESMAAKIDAIALRARDRLRRFQALEQDVKLGPSPVALQMAKQDRLSASGTPQSARENLVLHIESLRELAEAVRASARRAERVDSDVRATFDSTEVRP